MRRALAVLLIGVAAFALLLTVLLPTVVVARSKKTPLDLDITQISSGPATVLDASTNQTKAVRLRATREVKTDTKASDDTSTTVFETLCIVIVASPGTPDCLKAPDPRLLSVTTDRVTTDRKTAEAVHVAKYHEQINKKSTFNGQPVRHVGMAYKWPIDAKKKTYQFFQPDLNKAFPAVYSGTDTIKGLTVYKYVCATGPQPFKLQGLFDGTYDDTRTVWVEPRTGAIIDGTERQVQKLATGTVALDTTLSFEQSAIDYQSNYAKDKIDSLRVAQLWGPLVTALVAIAAIIGAFLLLRPRRRDGAGKRRGGSSASLAPAEATRNDSPVPFT
jgi:hypothetical protein